MDRSLLRRHDRPVPPAYWVAAATVGLVVVITFATARWRPWFIEDAGIGYGPQGVVSLSSIYGVGMAFGLLVAPACVLAFRWSGFAIALALLPLLVTALDPSRAPLHFGVLANLGAIVVTSSWRRPAMSVVATVAALGVVLGWLISGATMAAPFAAEIDLQYTRPGQLGIVYVVAFSLLLAFALWFRTVATREEERRRLAAREGEVADRAAVVAERSRLARDLHDVVAHHVSLIAVRAETAPYTEPELGEAGRRVLTDVAADARLALDELRGVLGILGRADEAERTPQPTLSDLAALVERSRRAGLEVHLSGDVHASVGAAAGYAAYRVVQECLTNARRHAAGAPVDITVATTARLLEVRVSNPVDEPPRGLRGGHGLAGMRERVEALGGRLRVQAAGARFEVEATLPATPPSGGPGAR